MKMWQRSDRTKKVPTGVGKMTVTGTLALFSVARSVGVGHWRNWKADSEEGCEGQLMWGEKRDVEKRIPSLYCWPPSQSRPPCLSLGLLLGPS